MVYRLYYGLLVCTALNRLVWSIPVDNGVEGDPEIECGSDQLTINVNTRNPFEGHVFIKNHNDDENCRSETGDGRRSVGGLTVSFDQCGITRMRSLEPKGVFVSTTVVIQMHPMFLTKVDKSYKIRCFYMEADKTVGTNTLGVSGIPTDIVQTSVVLMPICRYELFSTTDTGGIGDLIEYARVGDSVFHKWTCDTETEDTFCMILHSCFVDDSQGQQVEMIDESGCAVDRYILNNPEYMSDLMAGVEAHIFKFADRSEMYFQCQVTVLVKEPGESCPRPFCPQPPGRGAGSANPQLGPPPLPPQHPFPLEPGSPYLPQNYNQPPARESGGLPRGAFEGKRKKRAPKYEPQEETVGVNDAGIADVGASITVLDIGDRVSRDAPDNLSQSTELVRDEDVTIVCLSSETFSVFLSLSVCLVLTAVSVAIFVSVRKRIKFVF